MATMQVVAMIVEYSAHQGGQERMSRCGWVANLATRIDHVGGAA